jgi:hypothetical protein
LRDEGGSDRIGLTSSQLEFDKHSSHGSFLLF